MKRILYLLCFILSSSVEGQQLSESIKLNQLGVLPSGQKIVHWALLGEGRVQITRTDVKDYVEEWNIYVVQKDFEFAGVKFKRGDLAAYERPAIKITGNHSYQEVISPIFRHLQRLPD